MADQLNRPGEVATLRYLHDFVPRVFARYRRVAITYAARSYDRLGRYEELLELARRMRSEAPGDTVAFSTEAIALAGLGRLDELDALIEECRLLPGGECDVSWVMMRPTWYLAANGHHEKSQEFANRVADLLESLPEDEFIERQHDYLFALRTAERWDEYGALARELAESAEEGSRAQEYYSSCVGMAAGHSGDRETAEALISQFETSGNFYYAAQVAAYLGDLDRSIDSLQRSLEHQEGITYASLYRWDIDLQPLWNFPPFQEMVRPKG
jgi:tetratricopeptide (TPR) repeat protein